VTNNGRIPSRAELEAEGIRIVVAIPLERTLPSITFPAFWALAMRGWPLLDTAYGRTDIQRNKFAHALLATDFTHVCMLDLDHLHPASVVEQLAANVIHDPDRLVVGGLNFRRGAPFDPCAFELRAGVLKTVTDWQPGQVLEVGALGHGSLLVHRSVFERIEPPWWAYDYGRAEDEFYPSEDMYFSYLCREAGISMYVDTAVTSPHLIENVVTEDAWRAYTDALQSRVGG
jgi:hypothetical protein